MIIIDDDMAILDLLQSVFENDESIKLNTTSDSKKALALIDSQPYDIIVSDLMMPEISGIDLLKTAKENYPDVQVIIITAYSSLLVTLEIIKAGAYDYITKPFQIDEIMLVVNNAKEKIFLQRENKILKNKIYELERELEFVKEGNTSFNIPIEKNKDAVNEKITEQIKSAESEILINKFNSKKILHQNPYNKISNVQNEKYRQEVDRLNQLRNEGILTDDDFERLNNRLKTLFLSGKE